jgi:hypothetical protein
MCTCSTLDYVWNFQVSCFVNVTAERLKRIQLYDILKKLNFNVIYLFKFLLCVLVKCVHYEGKKNYNTYKSRVIKCVRYWFYACLCR